MSAQCGNWQTRFTSGSIGSPRGGSVGGWLGALSSCSPPRDARRTRRTRCLFSTSWMTINAGLPSNPAWFANLRANPRVTYQIGGARKIAQADIAPPELRDRLWTKLTTKFKGYLEYEKKTTRI